MGGIGSGAKPKTYPAPTVDAVRALYALGMTQDEVAAQIGTSQKVIWKVMLRHDIPTRPQAKRYQRGPMNDSWRGDRAGYQALHLRVRSVRGMPAPCSQCGTTDGRLEWANLTGDYADVNDYEAMCVSCHRRYDANRRRVTGRRTSPVRRGGGSQ